MAKKTTKKSVKKSATTSATKKLAKKSAAKPRKAAASASATRSASAKKPNSTAPKASTSKKSSTAKKASALKKAAPAKKSTQPSKRAGGRSASSASSARPIAAGPRRPARDAAHEFAVSASRGSGNEVASTDRFRADDAPRSFNPTRISATLPAPVIDDERDDEDRNDIDVIPGREGADIVTPRELGDGDHVSSDLEDGDGEDDDLVDENL